MDAISPLVKEVSFAAIDFESAGEYPGEAAHPIQVGIASMQRLEFEPARFFRSYLQTNRPVTWMAQRVHGITDQDLEGAPSMHTLWPIFQERLRGRFLVAHGSGTERRFLRAFPMHGFGPWVDTLTLSRQMLPGLSSYKLFDLLRHLGLLEQLASLLSDFRPHEALSDALASLVLLLHLIQKANLSDEPVSFLL